MTRVLQKLRDAVARLRRSIAARVRRLADRIDASVDAPKSQGVVS